MFFRRSKVYKPSECPSPQTKRIAYSPTKEYPFKTTPLSEMFFLFPEYLFPKTSVSPEQKAQGQANLSAERPIQTS